ncbi:unnamed protein product [Rotaria sp. Silwood2]|nr:unnamed protein product [Rotaria sp. Silwood2]CAF2811008.1 unnamed protein product [Rotaria sp. Silwood2]CAF2916054.1 unnamed protein product [Rotaria sp. Silwood2]CAF4054300.1 unnamed protein product [Rotaria sp. Silwood2]CAF4109129.1 unnamed protein product [Rotaria sp. Silwood2]
MPTYCFATLKNNVEESDVLCKDLLKIVRDLLGAHIFPDTTYFRPNLFKTHSGKIMQCILLKIVEPDFNNLGDTSTLNDPTVVEDLIETSPRIKFA